MHEGHLSNQTRTLHIEPPTLLAETLGYDGIARKVAFYWKAGDEAYYHDGYLSTQAEWDAYLLFVRHPLLVPELQGYNLGSSEEEATHWLLLDRDDRQIVVAPAKVAQQQLLAQWGTPTPEQVMVVESTAWDQLVAEITTRIACMSQELIVAHMMQHQLQVQDLAIWLEMTWKEQHMNAQQSENNRPTLTDIQALAAQLQFDFSGGGEQDGMFDLDKQGDPSLGGTWSKNEAGIDDAYGYLVRYQQTVQQIDRTQQGHM